MISLIEALNYRCLRYVRQPLKPFHVLVGPNGSGKTTFLDVVGFLHDLVTQGPRLAANKRSSNFYDLLWRQEGRTFGLAIEATIPPEQLNLLTGHDYTTVRYEVAITLDASTNEIGIHSERGMLLTASPQATDGEPPSPGRDNSKSFFRHDVPSNVEFLFDAPVSRDDLKERFGITTDTFAGWAAWTLGDMAVEVAEGAGRDKGLQRLNRFDAKKSLLAGATADEISYPVTGWLRQLLSSGVVRIALDGRKLGRPSPPGQGATIEPDGSNLAWVVADLERKSPKRHKEWVCHLQTALPELVDVTTVERPEDRHRYVSIVYRDGLTVPSWMASDGTLRLLALTLPAYLEGFKGIYLVEEPENAIHPLAIEAVYQSLSSVYDAQVLVATHSPVMLSVARLQDVLCFRKDEAGAATVVVGTEHEELKDWRGEVDLGTLFASGVLG